MTLVGVLLLLAEEPQQNKGSFLRPTRGQW
jgi:hypothetical protein